MLQIFPHLLRNLHAHSFLRFVSLPADVRRENYVLHRLQRRILQRFFAKTSSAAAAT